MIFLVHGKAKSGKDTVSDYIVKKTGAKKLWYAKNIKDFAMKYIGFTYDECYSKKTKESRGALQGIGDMFRENVDLLYWIDLIIQDICCSDNEHFVISDCRVVPEIIEPYRYFDSSKLSGVFTYRELVEYRNRYNIEDDYDAKYKNKCLSVSVVKPDRSDIECGENHITETGLDGFIFDECLNNNGTLEDLYKKIDNILLKIGVI